GRERKRERNTQKKKKKKKKGKEKKKRERNLICIVRFSDRDQYGQPHREFFSREPRFFANGEMKIRKNARANLVRRFAKRGKQSYAIEVMVSYSLMIPMSMGRLQGKVCS
ncbi:uncharacterized protein V1477_016434, partial [Vespula maculifrons]